jgi:hypothetical protein
MQLIVYQDIYRVIEFLHLPLGCVNVELSVVVSGYGQITPISIFTTLIAHAEPQTESAQKSNEVDNLSASNFEFVFFDKHNFILLFSFIVIKEYAFFAISPDQP